MKLIVVEGIDGSGKQTQVELLVGFLEKSGAKVQKLTFPNYASDSSALVRMYMNGEFGTDAEQVNPYAASSFYAADRFACFAQNPHLLDCDYIIADRYTTSNMVHQASKMQGGGREEFLAWLEDYEYRLLKIPRPDAVVLLDIPADFAMTKSRAAKFAGEDIHEGNNEYMQKCRECARFCAEKQRWIIVGCEKNGEMMSIEQVHVAIINALTREAILNC